MVDNIELKTRKLRANIFLKDVMGRKKYDKFIKNGIIDIKSGEVTYVLTEEGKIINKKTLQEYCIVTGPSMIHYPLADIIAIRYCWTKYRNDIVEEVANKRPLSYDEKIKINNKIDNKNILSTFDGYYLLILFMLVCILTASAILLVYVIVKY